MTFCLMRPNCWNKSLNHVRLYLRLRGFIDNLRASNLDISVRIWAEEPRRFYGSPGGGVALKKHLTKPPEFRGSLFPKGAQCLMIEDQGALDDWSIGPLVECQMLNVNKVQLLSEPNSGVPPVIFSCPGSSVPDLGQWVTHWLPLSNFDKKRLLLRLETLQTFDQSGVW